MHRIVASILWAALPAAAAAQGIYSPSVVHGTSDRPAVMRPAVPLQPAAPASGAASLAPSVVLGWGGLPPSSGVPRPGLAVPVQPLPGYPVQVVPVPVPVYPSPYAPVYPSIHPPMPMPPPGTLHRWSAP